jgi:hypothetical protein
MSIKVPANNTIGSDKDNKDFLREFVKEYLQAEKNKLNNLLNEYIEAHKELEDKKTFHPLYLKF